jgi:adenine-specific DNA-methyltransferase
MTDSHSKSTAIQPDPTEQPEHLNLRSHDIVNDKQAEIIRLFPEVRTEGGKLDFDRLKRVLGEIVDPGKERYSMNWPGKADCFKAIQSPSLGTLRPRREESLDFDTTENVIIEGDSLEALKLMQKAYLGKIKMIYIDPPYNTGKDFIYPDNYSESLQTYLEYTGQVDVTRKRFSTNTEADGRFHSKWMSMMYPRLYLARNLMTEDGVIFVSIDDHELSNLRKLCDEVFGEECFKGMIVRATGQTTGQDSGGLGASFDYVLVYFKSPDVELAGLELSEDDLERYQEEDSRGKYALWQLRKTGKNDRREDRPNMFFPIKNPDGEDVLPIGPTGYESRWRFDPKGFQRLVSQDYIVWKKRKNGDGEQWWPYVKTYLEGRTKRPSPLWDDIEGSKKASIDLRALMGGNVFDNPKPVGLVRRLLQIVPEPNADCLLLDFFAGSGTTAQAALELNEEDGGSRRFILIQLPEPCPEGSEALQAGYKSITDITRERVRRAVKQLKGAEPPITAPKQAGDTGFRSLKLDSSNFKVWDGTQKVEDDVALANQLELHVQHMQQNRTAEDVLFELLLKSGFAVTTKVESVKMDDKTVFSIADGAMLLCLEQKITLELIKGIAERKPERVVCLDEGFAGNDQLKANAVQIMKSKGVTSFRTV